MTLLLWLGALTDAAILTAAALFGLHPGVALLVHLLLTLACIALWWRSGVARRFAPALGMALGPIGIVCSMISPPIGALSRRWRFLRVRPDQDSAGSIAPAPGKSGGAMVARLLDGRVSHPDPDSMGSLIGILRNGDVDDRRGALEAAVRSFDPRLSVVVAKALTDDDQTIRALAAAAASRIAQRLAEDRLALTEAVAAGEPDIAEHLRAALMDHSRFDVLLSDTQRDQIAKDVSLIDGAHAPGSATPDAAGEERWLAHALKESWKAQDFEAIDLICRKAARNDRLNPDPLWTAARWWAAQPCS